MSQFADDSCRQPRLSPLDKVSCRLYVASRLVRYMGGTMHSTTDDLAAVVLFGTLAAAMLAAVAVGLVAAYGFGV